MRKDELTPQLFDKFANTRTLHGLINTTQDPRSLPVDAFEIPIDELVEFFKAESKKRKEAVEELSAKLNSNSSTLPYSLDSLQPHDVTRLINEIERKLELP